LSTTDFIAGSLILVSENGAVCEGDIGINLSRCHTYWNCRYHFLVP